MRYGISGKHALSFRWIAIVGIVLYAVVRSMVVWATLESYGVNPWIFLLIDASTGVTYVLGLEQLLRGLSAKDNSQLGRTFLWGVITILSFAAPYVYLFWSGQKMPFTFVVGIGVVVCLLLVNAIVNIYRRIQRK